MFMSPGAQVDHMDKEGNTPLHIASRYGHELLVETLLNYGADPKRLVLIGQLRNFPACSAIFPFSLAVLENRK